MQYIFSCLWNSLTWQTIFCFHWDGGSQPATTMSLCSNVATMLLCGLSCFIKKEKTTYRTCFFPVILLFYVVIQTKVLNPRWSKKKPRLKVLDHKTVIKVLIWRLYSGLQLFLITITNPYKTSCPIFHNLIKKNT